MKSRQYCGYTLIELVISMTIIGIAILGTLLAINTSVLFSGNPLISHQAVAIAESYLEEISTKDFFISPCPAVPSPGGRANFTNVCHYNGLSQAPTDQNGNAISALSAYSVAVAVNSTTASLGSPSLTPGTQMVRVDVSVSHPVIPTMTFSVYKTSY
jgi:MSHA pilin protein MshD